MSEEIIIDGVNVKDCRRRFGKNSYCRYFKRPCADNNFNCIWKQNERLKQENAKLKEENFKLGQFDIKKVTLIENRQLEEENKKLKEKLENIKEIAETALKANYCNNCDGVGIPDCDDYECHTYALDKIMDVLEGVEDEN